MTSAPVHTEKNSKTNILFILFGLLLALLGGLLLLTLSGYGFVETNTLLGITAKTPWYFTRAAGTVAYLLMAGSTIWGLLLSTKLIKESVPAALALTMHNMLSWLAIVLAGLHLTSISFSFRKQIGQKRWRQLHYLTFIAFVLVTIHGVFAGTDSGNGGLRFVYWGSGLLVLFLTNYRLLTAKVK